MKTKLLAALFLLTLGVNAFGAAPDLSVGSFSGIAGATVAVPIMADYATATPADAQFTLKYDPAVLTVSSVTVGSATTGWTIVDNPNTPGTLIVAMFSPTGIPVTGSAQQIAVVNFTVSIGPGTLPSPNLTLSAAILGNTTITDLTNGNFTLNLLGDVNGDGKVTIADAILVAQECVGLTTMTDAQKALAQVDHTSSVNIYDAYLIAELVAGKITSF